MSSIGRNDPCGSGINYEKCKINQMIVNFMDVMRLMRPIKNYICGKLKAASILLQNKHPIFRPFYFYQWVPHPELTMCGQKV